MRIDANMGVICGTRVCTGGLAGRGVGAPGRLARKCGVLASRRVAMSLDGLFRGCRRQSSHPTRLRIINYRTFTIARWCRRRRRIFFGRCGRKRWGRMAERGTWNSERGTGTAQQEPHQGRRGELGNRDGCHFAAQPCH